MKKQIKIFELRDKATFIPIVAFSLLPENESERYLLGRAGFGVKPRNQYMYVFMHVLNTGECHHDQYDWGSNMRTFGVIHKFLNEKFDSLVPGQVLDVEFILGEKDKPKISEQEY